MSHSVTLFSSNRRYSENQQPWQISATGLILTIATTVATFYNLTFWSKLFSRFNDFTVANISFAVTFLLLIIALTGLLLSLLVLPKIAKPILGILFFSSALIAHFNALGVVIDEQMIVNLLQTDTHEAADLFTPSLLFYVCLLGVLPTLLVSRLNIRFGSRNREIGIRFLVVTLLLALAVALFYTNFRYSTYFGRENRDLRLYLNPLFPLLSVKKAAADQITMSSDFKILGADARVEQSDSHTHLHSRPHRTIGIMIVGETARADHFSLNGYGPLTNPQLAKQTLLNFPNATSCGTSTAYSVPCMFSFLSAQEYDPQTAAGQSNLLDVLKSAGIETLWRDNNSTCKGVCVRSAEENYRTHADSTSIYFNDGEYFDEILLENLPDIIHRSQGDLFIVLHQLGSHGPAYFKRYPKAFEQFTPACKQLDPSQCNQEEVNNSYDNTILYTDHVINKTIDLLNNSQEGVDSFVLYVSDHGESLGENGVYLHGLPKSMAPKEQTHIPFMLWLSSGIQDQFGDTQNYSEHCLKAPISHDNIVHTILGLFSVRTELRDESLNLLNSRCTQHETR